MLIYILVEVQCFYQPIENGLMTAVQRNYTDIEYYWNVLKFFYARFSLISNLDSLGFILFEESVSVTYLVLLNDLNL